MSRTRPSGPRRIQGLYVTMRVPLAVLVVSVAAALGPGEAVLVAVLGDVAVLILLAVDVARAPSPARLQLERDVPAVVSVGRPTAIGVRLHNPVTRRLEVHVRDATAPSLRRDPPRHRTVLQPGAWARLEATILPERRGRFVLGPVTVRTSGPLRLGGRQGTIGPVHGLKVYPALPSRVEVELRVERARLLQVGQRSSAVRGGGTDFDSLADYHPDHEFRRINWRATARATRAISNVYREERNQQVVLLLDAGRTMAGTVAGSSRLEHAVDAGFAVAELAARVGDQVGVVAFSGAVKAMVAPRAGRGHPRRIVDALFDLEPTLEAANYGGAFVALLAHHARRSLLVLLTELTEESALDALFLAMPALLARHLVIVGMVADPEVERLARADPASSEEAYLKAAATAAALWRDRAAVRLRGMGAVVVDAPPGRLAGRLADQYLRIKAFGRL